MEQDLKDFLENNRISQEDWEKSECDWEALKKIKEDHKNQIQMLSESAALYAKMIQSIPEVHSVRWRIKDSDHLLEKIIRKKAKKEEKYKDISVENYYLKVTDLVGVRALHLFKNDCFKINQKIAKLFYIKEPPLAYIRAGDPSELITKYQGSGLTVAEHPAGYRSIHYVTSSKPLTREVFSELQVRTIFEEGWSEIDHRVRYPNFSDNELTNYFLTIFNRMAGSADEMGSFVTMLASTVKDHQEQLKNIFSEKEEAAKNNEASSSKIEALIKNLSKEKQRNESSEQTIQELESQIYKILHENKRLNDLLYSKEKSFVHLKNTFNTNKLITPKNIPDINKFNLVYRKLGIQTDLNDLLREQKKPKKYPK